MRDFNSNVELLLITLVSIGWRQFKIIIAMHKTSLDSSRSDFSILATFTYRFHFCNCSEFEELEAVPTMAVMDGPLEPSATATSSAADVPDDPAFINFFSVSSERNFNLLIFEE